MNQALKFLLENNPFYVAVNSTWQRECQELDSRTWNSLWTEIILEQNCELVEHHDIPEDACDNVEVTDSEDKV